MDPNITYHPYELLQITKTPPSASPVEHIQKQAPYPLTENTRYYPYRSALSLVRHSPDPLLRSCVGPPGERAVHISSISIQYSLVTTQPKTIHLCPSFQRTVTRPLPEVVLIQRSLAGTEQSNPPLVFPLPYSRSAQPSPASTHASPSPA